MTIACRDSRPLAGCLSEKRPAATASRWKTSNTPRRNDATVATRGPDRDREQALPGYHRVARHARRVSARSVPDHQYQEPGRFEVTGHSQQSLLGAGRDKRLRGRLARDPGIARVEDGLAETVCLGDARHGQRHTTLADDLEG